MMLLRGTLVAVYPHAIEAPVLTKLATTTHRDFSSSEVTHFGASCRVNSRAAKPSPMIVANRNVRVVRHLTRAPDEATGPSRTGGMRSTNRPSGCYRTADICGCQLAFD
jgi:hypothetical protein